jgi:hypothetical protein
LRFNSEQAFEKIFIWDFVLFLSLAVQTISFHILYIDPGTGSLLLQLIAGGLIASAVFFKKTWYSFLSIFRKKPSEPENEE